LSTKEATLKVPCTHNHGWVKFNAGQSGFFRVKYSEELSTRLGSAIKDLSLSTGDRLGVQNDAFALAKSGAIPLTQALALVQNYVNETEYTTWSDLSSNLDAVSSLLAGTEAEAYLRKYALKLYSKIGSLGWDAVSGEKDLNKLLRSVVLSALGDAGDQTVIAEAKKRFEIYLSDKKSLSNDLVGVVFKLTMRNGGQVEYDQMLNVFHKATQPEEVIRALRSVGLSNDPQLIQKALDFALTDAVRTQDIFYVFHSCASTVHGRDLTWAFVQKHWDQLTAKLSGGMALLGRIVAFATQSYASEAKAAEVEAFLKPRTTHAIERTISQSLESIHANASYLTKNLHDVTAWLKHNA